MNTANAIYGFQPSLQVMSYGYDISEHDGAFGRANVQAYFARGAVRPDPAGRAFCED
jgi:hypothetical protein